MLAAAVDGRAVAATQRRYAAHLDNSDCNVLAYHPLSLSGVADYSEASLEAVHADLGVLPLSVQDPAVAARGLACAQHPGKRHRSLAFCAMLPFTAVLTWLGGSGQQFGHYQLSNHWGDSRPDRESVVKAEIPYSEYLARHASLSELPGRLGLGAKPWVPENCQLPSSHTRCPDMEANAEHMFDTTKTVWTGKVRHVGGPEKCCAMCQGNEKCRAWSWVKNAGPYENWYVCFMKGDKPSGKRAAPGVISGLPPVRVPLGHEEKATYTKGVSLYCFSLVRPASYEVDLIKVQEVHGAGIFACNEGMIYSNQAIQIGSMTASVVNTDLQCSFGGDFGKALNSWIFIEVWRKVIDESRYYHHDWTVKVDPDAAFFPRRLQIILQDHQKADYINNCAEGMHGPIEVLSRDAVGALAWDYRRSRNKTFPKGCVAAQELSRWGEDMFLDKCLGETLGMRSELDVRLMCEGACGCPDWYWCLNGTTRASFHPFKSADSYSNCLANALHSGAAQPMPPTPKPCIGAGGQCGGRDWTGTSCCVKGYVCRQNSSWYSECQPTCAGPEEQCGGHRWQGATCCTGGYVCVEKDKWYSQCRPPWSLVINRSTGTGDAACAGALRQCSGRGYTGPTCCPTGYICWRKNAWYSQCKVQSLTKAANSTTTWTSTPQVSTVAPCALPGQQCGGMDYSGSKCCTRGYSCHRENAWYSSCSQEEHQ